MEDPYPQERGIMTNPTKAIVLSHENANLISETQTVTYPKWPLTADRIHEMVDMPNRVKPGEKVYFICNFVSESGLNTGGWATYPERFFLDEYEADMELIESEFVEIRRKI